MYLSVLIYFTNEYIIAYSLYILIHKYTINPTYNFKYLLNSYKNYGILQSADIIVYSYLKTN